MRQILRNSIFVIFFLLAFFVFKTDIQAVNYGSGVYTNICGTGLEASANKCNAGCNLSSGSCSKATNRVVKYTCDGRQTECRSNESGFANSHSLAGTACGKTVQIDVFSKPCRDGNGNWTCSDSDLQDYIVWYSGDCQQTGETCQDQKPIDTQFRVASEGGDWINGSKMSSKNLSAGTQVDVNCFAKNGSALLKDSVIDVRKPNGQTERVSNTGELRGYQLADTGTYSFNCSSTAFDNCSNQDSFRVRPGSTPRPTPPIDQKSSCDELSIVSGNDQTVPAKVVLRGKGSDNYGNISRYRFYFGDGQNTETDAAEVTHTYESSGTFMARVDVRDTRGRWISSDRCEARVKVRPNPVESHKSGCSDVFITSDNNGQAPSNVTFKVTGYDNKTDIKRYKLDFGNGIVKEADGQVFEQRYETAGTYAIKAYIQDSEGNWKGGDNSCKRNLYVNTKPIKSQPSTGTPTLVSLVGFGSGLASLTLYMLRKQVR